jgi:fatty-acyl-CoA synthase
LRDVATGTARIARGLVPLRRATPRRLVRISGAMSTHGLSVAGLTRVAAIRNGRDIVLIDRHGPLSAEQLDRWANTVAGELARRELVAPGGRLGVLCRSGRGFLIATAAASCIGADAVLLHPGYRPVELADVIRAQDLRVVVHDDDLGELLGAAGFRGTGIIADVAVPGLLSVPGLAALPQADLAAPPRPGRLVLLSSGRGGRPRSAHRAPPGAAAALPLTTLLRRLQIRRGAPVLVLPPLHHPLGIGFMAVSLGLGCPAVVRERFDADETLRLMDEHAVQTLVTLPRMLLQLAEAAAGHRPASLRVIVSGGGPLLPNVWRRATDAFGPIVHNVYGSVATGWCTLATPDDLAVAPGTIGRPAAGVELAILGDDHQPVPPGVLGDVYVASPTADPGADRRRVRGGRWVAARDVGHSDEAGHLFVDARAGLLIDVAGHRLAPGAIEDALLAHPAVADAAVSAQPESDRQTRIVARVQLRPGAAVTADDLRAHVGGWLGPHARPDDVRLVSAIPLSDAGQPRPLE